MLAGIGSTRAPSSYKENKKQMRQNHDTNMFNVLEILLIILGNKVDSEAVVTEATRAANTMEVRFRVLLINEYGGVK